MHTVTAQVDSADRISQAFAALQAERPEFHFVGDEPVQWSIGPQTLFWMLDYLPQARATLETGCGFSTVLFAAAGTEHVVVTPESAEVERVRDFCGLHGISTDRVREVIGDSTVALPAVSLPELDLVLIDGAHAFPIPCIDWYFTQSALRVGGHLVVDDFRIPSVAPLVRFLRAERPAWREATVTGNSIIFEKLGHDDFSRDWAGQYINRYAMRPPLPRRIRLKLRRTWRDARRALSSRVP
jgi:predicted O-methyltransferase YrrM